MKGLTKTESAIAIIGGILLAAIVIGACSLLSGWILMLLWNWIAVGVFKAPVLTYWQAVGFSLLLSVIGSYFRNATKTS